MFQHRLLLCLHKIVAVVRLWWLDSDRLLSSATVWRGDLTPDSVQIKGMETTEEKQQSWRFALRALCS
jgi:hypothetical protein